MALVSMQSSQEKGTEYMVNREPMVLDSTRQGQPEKDTEGEPENDVVGDTTQPVCIDRPPLQDCTDTLSPREGGVQTDITRGGNGHWKRG